MAHVGGLAQRVHAQADQSLGFLVAHHGHAVLARLLLASGTRVDTVAAGVADGGKAARHDSR